VLPENPPITQASAGIDKNLAHRADDYATTTLKPQLNYDCKSLRYAARAVPLKNMDLTSKAAQVIVSTFDKLDQSCPH
jgi:hypothetical protein